MYLKTEMRYHYSKPVQQARQRTVCVNQCILVHVLINQEN